MSLMSCRASGLPSGPKKSRHEQGIPFETGLQDKVSTATHFRKPGGYMLQDEYQLHFARLTSISDHTDIPEPRNEKLIIKGSAFFACLGVRKKHMRMS
jgi:hypothetical protein